jgi:acetyltransferase-like isoleucine patch superfamily enzyme
MTILKIFYNWIRNRKLRHIVKNGNFFVSKSAIIDNCEVVIARPVKGKLNLRVGDNSNVSCKFVILNPSATITVGNRVFIGADTLIFCYEDIVIEDDVMISWGCTVTDTNAHSISSLERLQDVLDWNKGEQYKNWAVVKHLPTIIKKQSWVGFNSTILKGVEIGEGAIVAAASVVTKSVNPYTIVAGNPAKYIKDAAK